MMSLWSSSSRGNWERLVAAVLKREQIWQLCHQHSRSPSISTISSDDYSEQFLSFSSNKLEQISAYPQVGPAVSQVSNNGSPVPFKRNLFSAWYRRRKSKDEDWFDIPEDVAVHLGQLRRFSLHELRVATEDFSNKNLVPGAWEVYRGWLADGFQVAIRSYKELRGENTRFQRVVEINNSIAAHPNIVHILGFCITPKRWLLVYPLMVNGSVRSCLRDRHESQPPLNWPMRKGIALGVAKGLVHLHEECDKKFLHRDIKAANILLNEDFEAVVADFDLGLILEHNATYIEDAVRGTIGHIAPEYLSTSKCSDKNDVFGYGVFLLELISGQRALDLARLASDEDVMMLGWVKSCYNTRKWQVLIDANGGVNYMEDVVEQLVQIALLCTQEDPLKRPKMSEVMKMLELQDRMPEEWYEEEIFRQEVRKHWSDEEMSIHDVSDMLADDLLDLPR